MSLVTAALIAFTLLLDVFGQLAFKLGLNRIDSQAGAVRFWVLLLRQPWLLLGVAAYGLEFFLWLAVLSKTDLSLAYPLASLSYCGVLLASRLALAETISRRRWLGCGLITLGAALVCASP